MALRRRTHLFLAILVGFGAGPAQADAPLANSGIEAVQPLLSALTLIDRGHDTMSRAETLVQIAARAPAGGAHAGS